MDHAEKVMHLVPISEMVDRMVPVGSRVTCDPAPTDTDEDYLLLVAPNGLELDPKYDDRYYALERYLHEHGWTRGGSLPAEIGVTIPPEQRFESWTFDEINLILTTSNIFYQRFLAATAVAKRLNLLNKPDRIALFQAVLYGAYDED